MESHWITNPLLSGYLGYSLLVLKPKSLMGLWLFYPPIVDADSVYTSRVNGSPQRTLLAPSRHELLTKEDGFAGRGDCWLFVHQHQWVARLEERDLRSRVSTPLNDYNYFGFKLHNSVMYRFSICWVQHAKYICKFSGIVSLCLSYSSCIFIETLEKQLSYWEFKREYCYLSTRVFSCVEEHFGGIKEAIRDSPRIASLVAWTMVLRARNQFEFLIEKPWYENPHPFSNGVWWS